MTSREARVAGRGEYLADMVTDDALQAAFVRSDDAFARITAIDVTAARDLPGVKAVYTWSDLREELTPGESESPSPGGLRYPLAHEFVRYVGEPLAVVLADSREAAEDGAEAVFYEAQTLPAPMDIHDAATSDRQLHSDVVGNVIFQDTRGRGDVEAAFESCAHVVRRSLRTARQTPFPLECRGVRARSNADGEGLTIWTSTQIPHIVRDAVAESLGLAADQVRVIVPDVGGGFGLKAQVFPEEIVIAALARRVAQPIVWVEDRRENLLASGHGHEIEFDITLGADDEGRIQALRADISVDVGAYPGYPFSGSLEASTAASSLFGCYSIPHVTLNLRGVTTSKCPSGPYRGVGGPSACFATELVLDEMAAAVGLDRVSFRLLNLISASESPRIAPSGAELDEGDYQDALQKLTAGEPFQRLLGKYRDPQVPARKARGLGFSVVNKHTGNGSAAYKRRRLSKIPGIDAAVASLSRGGDLALAVSSADAGQGHSRAYQAVAGELLGVPRDTVRIIEGDTALCPSGTGTFASRNAPSQLSAAALAVQELERAMRLRAAAYFDAAPEELGLGDGAYSCGVDRLTFSEIAALEDPDPDRAHDEDLGQKQDVALEGRASYDPQPAYAFGVHASLVEVDLDELSVELLDHVLLEDCGTIIDEDSVREQVVGGVATGIGIALLESISYDSGGQPRTSSVMDYLVPVASSMPTISAVMQQTPTDRTILGARGAAELSTVGSVGAICSAVADALGPAGRAINSMPVTPMVLFSALQPDTASVAKIDQLATGTPTISGGVLRGA